MVKSIVAAVVVISAMVGSASATRAGARSVAQSAGPPPGAHLVGRSVSVDRHPCSSERSKSCRGVVTIEVYKLPGPTAPPAGSVVPSVRVQIAAKGASFARGQRLHPFVRARSGCTGCGSWYFGCPNYLYESVQWDEQDYLGVPIYHQQQQNEDRVTCQYAWTIWRNVQNCQTYQVFWACEYPIPNSDFWDGAYHEDWSNTQFKYNPFPYDCELDTVYLRTYTAPSGYVQASAWRSMSGC